MRTEVAVAILFALEEEFNYFEPMIPSEGRDDNTDEITGRTFVLFNYPTRNGGYYRCVTGFVGSMGNPDALAFTLEMNRRFNPKNLVWVGLAGSLDRDVRLGDIVIADEVTDYEQDGKITKRALRPSGRHYRAHARLTNIIRTLTLRAEVKKELATQLAANLQDIVKPADLALAGHAARTEAAKHHTGHLASGPTVVASASAAARLRAQDRKFLALDMESAGVMNAAYQGALDSKLLIIRGISDMCDERKTSLDGASSFRALAMVNALTLLKLILDASLFVNQSTAIPENKKATFGQPSEYLLEFDCSNEFVGGLEQVRTSAMLLNRLRAQHLGTVSTTIIHRGLARAENRCAELALQSDETAEEQQEYRHLFVVKDFLEVSNKEISYVVDLVANDNRFSKYLTSEASLTQFLVGIRNVKFGLGSPHFLGQPSSPYSVKDSVNLPNEWCAWWNGDIDGFFYTRLSDEDISFIKRQRRADDGAGAEVLGDKWAFDVFHLSEDGTWGKFLPSALIYMSRRWKSRSEIPDAALDLKNWFIAPVLPKNARGPAVHTKEFKDLIAREVALRLGANERQS